MAARVTALQVVITLVIATGTGAWAEETGEHAPLSSKPSLAEQSPLSRVSGVSQFGMPGDHKYIFCDAADCQERTPKHFNDPTPPLVKKESEPMRPRPADETPKDMTKSAPVKMPKSNAPKRSKVRKYRSDCAVPK